MADIQIDFVDPDDGDRLFHAVGVGIRHRSAEEHLLIAIGPTAVDHFGQIEPLRQEAYAPIDFPQLALAVDVVAVLRAVAVGGGPGDHAHDFRACFIEQMQQLVLEPLVAGWRDVIFGTGRQCGQTCFEVVVVLIFGFFDKGFVHAGIIAAVFECCVLRLILQGTPIDAQAGACAMDARPRAQIAPGACDCKKCVQASSIFLKVRYNLVLDVRL